ncbi:MAG: ribonuclease Z [Natronohydrobacter sp.]|nr:ribonuclease Z [Natronohydrobacter sp.]
MDLKFLGTGGAYDVAYGNSAATIDLDQRILIDCGPSVFPALLENGLIDTIDALLLTHLHGDHSGGLFQLAFFLNRKLGRRLRIACPSDAFAQQIRGLLRAFGVPDDFCDVLPLDALGGVSAIETTGRHAPGLTSFAYVFEQGAQVIFYSGDLGDVSVAERFLATEDRIVTVFHDMTEARTPAHAHYSAVETLLGRAQVFAYHLDPRAIPAENRVPLVQNHPEFLWSDRLQRR